MDPHLLLDRNTFLTRFGSSDPNNRVLRRLHALASADDTGNGNGIEWLEDIVQWLFERGEAPGRLAGEREIDTRTRLLLTAAEEIPPFAERLRGVMLKALMGSSATMLFTDTGVPSNFGFWGEVVERFSENLLPAYPVGREVSRLLGRLIDSPERAEWLLSMPESVRTRLSTMLGLDTETVKRALDPGLREAAVLLASRIAMQGISDDLRKRMPSVAVASSPFLLLPEHVKGLLKGELPLAPLLATITACRACLRDVTASLDETGISIDLVFRLELINALLTRLLHLVTILCGLEEARELAQVQLERELIRGTVADKTLTALLQSSTRLLARRVVERAGSSGEHYVTKTRTEQQAMLDAAAGGGAITAVMVFTKFFIGFAHPPPFFDALFVGLNYAWGFVAMQLLHFALATKQPAMTAATLAGAIEAQRDEEKPELAPLVDLVSRASRTQFTALLGNVFVVMPFAIVIGLIYQSVMGQHVLSSEYAEKIVRVHHPIFSVTIFSAIMTGVWLWAASLLAGAAENYFVLRELPGAIATNRTLRRVFGASRANRLSRFLTEQASGFGGNVGFGMLLGFMPMLIGLLGIPLEVRHVTFVTGQLAYAAVELGPAVFGRTDFLLALLSIPLVGLINFGVSFTFAIVVALRARGLGVRSQVSLARAVMRRFVASPLEFFLAPPEEPVVKEAASRLAA
ncbi:MAG: gliding motility protein [Archangium sp.]|nr:gliding motility protein [Archangium sp.]